MLTLGFPRLSGGVGWKHLLGAGMLGSIGFTMSIFISGLAFGGGQALDAAKLAVFFASAVAGVLGSSSSGLPAREGGIPRPIGN